MHRLRAARPSLRSSSLLHDIFMPDFKSKHVDKDSLYLHSEACAPSRSIWRAWSPVWAAGEPLSRVSRSPSRQEECPGYVLPGHHCALTLCFTGIPFLSIPAVRVQVLSLHHKTLTKQQITFTLHWLVAPAARYQMLWPAEPHDSMCCSPVRAGAAPGTGQGGGSSIDSRQTGGQWQPQTGPPACMHSTVSMQLALLGTLYGSSFRWT